MSILLLFLKNQLRSYRKALKKALPLMGALLVLILLVADSAGQAVRSQVLRHANLPLVYTVVCLLFAGRRILFLKYPPFFFSLPGLYFLLTTPVNHRLVLAGKILRSYLPLLFLGFGWSRLAGADPAGLPGGADLFFYLATLVNISWLLYNTESGRLTLRKLLLFLAIMLMLFMKTPGFVWVLLAAGSFGWALFAADTINWAKYENHCRLAYLSRKYFLTGDWGSMETLTAELRQPPAASFFTTRMYATGRWAFTYVQILLLSRFPFLSWVLLLGQAAFSVLLMRQGEFLPRFGGSLFLGLGFVGSFALPAQKLKQKMAQGLYPAGDFFTFLTGMLIMPAAVALLLLTGVVLFASPGLKPSWALMAAFFPAVILSYLAIVKGMSGPAFSAWFVFGLFLFALLFSLLGGAHWGEACAVLLLFIPYGFFSGRRMKGIYEGAEVLSG